MTVYQARPISSGSVHPWFHHLFGRSCSPVFLILTSKAFAYTEGKPHNRPQYHFVGNQATELCHFFMDLSILNIGVGHNSRLCTSPCKSEGLLLEKHCITRLPAQSWETWSAMADRNPVPDVSVHRMLTCWPYGPFVGRIFIFNVKADQLHHSQQINTIQSYLDN